MKKFDKREKNLLKVLAVLLLIGAVDLLMNMDSYLSFYKETETKVEQNKKPQIKNTNKKTRSKALIASLQNWGRDPFFDPALQVRKVVYKPKIKKISLNLKAISMAANMSVAMINSSVLTIGDKIEGYTVQKIQAKQVTLIKDGQTTTLKLQ